MKSWLIVIPVWGAAYRELFLDAVLPSIELALSQVGTPARFLIHTDRPDKLAPAFKHPVEFREIPAGSKYEAFGRGHQEGLKEAKTGEYVALLNADMVCSIETFSCCEEHFANGKTAILCNGQRTLQGRELPPVGVDAATLIDWCLAHLHPINRDCFFRKGHTSTPSVVYFEDKEGLVWRCFHIHPVAVVKDARMRFTGTVDRDLVDCFSDEEMHVVVDRNEMAFAEISPETKVFPSRELITENVIINWARRGASPRHRHLFRYPIVLRGKRSGMDEAPTQTILRSLGSRV